MKKLNVHRWEFFQQGGFEQVYINSVADLENLKNLDQKLWAALACTIDGLEFNSKFFNYIDANGDGRIRVPEVLAIVDFALQNLANPAVLFENRKLLLTDLAEQPGLVASANYLFELLERAPEEGLNYQDTADLTKLFPTDRTNGDGIVPADLASDPALKAFIGQIIEFCGGCKDRSGAAGADAASLGKFTAGLQQLHAWQQDSEAEFIEQLSADENADLARLAALVGEPNIEKLANSDLAAQLSALIEVDLADAEVANNLIDLDKLLLSQEYLITLLRNFVSLQDFYQQQPLAIFQAGRLYIDGKSCDFTLQVADPEAHSAIATKSFNYLIYCKCTRQNDPAAGELNIVAAVTAGAEGDLAVGRNGLFYDRKGQDWDAQVVKVIANPISVREAFWSPYRRIAHFISDKIQQFAANRDAEVFKKTVDSANADNKPGAFDIGKFAGIFAAIGLAMAALGAALATLVSGMSSLIWWQWLIVLAGVMVFISGPSILLAWFKLRRRNLGPMLDANGWAVNSRALISIPFGTNLTQLAQLPKGAKQVNLEGKSRAKWWFLTGAVLAVAAWATWHYDLINMALNALS